MLVDYDVVAASNVNRQVLFSSGDVGRRKVEAGEEGLQRHNIRTSQSQYCSSIPVTYIPLSPNTHTNSHTSHTPHTHTHTYITFVFTF